MTTQRWLCGLLVVPGTLFAMIVWPFLLAPFAAFHSDSGPGWGAVAGSVGLCVLALTGYFVWWNWLQIARGIRPSFRKLMWVWGTSLLNHLAWLIVFLLMRNESPLNVIGTMPPLLTIWILTNLAIAACSLILCESVDFTTSPDSGPPLPEGIDSSRRGSRQGM